MPVTHGQGNPDWTRDETILALDLVLRHWPKIPGKLSAEVKALSNLLRQLPIHSETKKNDRFRNPDGVYLKLQNLASLHPDKRDRKGLRTSRMDRAVWEAFAAKPDAVRLLASQIAVAIEVIQSEESVTLDDNAFEAQEGVVLAQVHQIRERKRGFRKRLIRRVEGTHGVVQCAACGLAATNDSSIVYSMFEVHHLAPLSEVATTVTRLDDLALLCANCHRLIHAVMRKESRHFNLIDFRGWLEQMGTLVDWRPCP